MRRPVVTLACAAVLATACAAEGQVAAGGGDGTSGAASAAPTGSPTPTDDGDVPEAYAFSAPALDGGAVEGAEYAGRDLVLWMWAPW